MTEHFKSIGALSSAVVSPWAWWQAALKDPDAIGKTLKASESDPQQGYYRTRSKGGQWEPVAIWKDPETGAWLGYRNGREARDVNELWVWSLRYPISHAAYENAMAGNGFEDEPPAPIGDNSDEADPFEALRVEYLGEKELAEEFMQQPVKTQAQADKVAIWAKRLTTIKSKAEGLHKVEKQPHLDAGRAVDNKWRDLKEEPDELAKRLKLHIKPFLQEQIRAEEERQRKAREEAERMAAEARQAQLEADNAKAYAMADSDAGQDAEAERKAEEARRASALAQAAAAEAEARKVNAGRTGARVSMRTEKVGVVTDYAKAAAALVAMNHKDIVAVIDQLAQRAAKAGMPFDGMEIRTEEKVV